MTTKRINSRILTILLVIIIYSTSCERSIFGIKGEGNIVSQTFTTDYFDEIFLTIDADVIIKNDTETDITIEAQQNIIDNIELEVKKDALKIKYDRNVSDHEDVKIYISVDYLQKIISTGSGDISVLSEYSGTDLDLDVTGTGDIIFNNTVDYTDLFLHISGTGKIDIDGIFSQTRVETSGSGDIYIAGSSTDLIITTTGSGQFNGTDFECENAQITSTGFGDCNIFVNNLLDALLTGSGNIYYIGKPSINSNISGTGRIIDMN